MTLELAGSGVAQAAVPFARDLAAHGRSTALVVGERRISYGELSELVEDFALSLGTTRCVVQLAARNDLESVIAYLAALRVGYPLLMAPGDNPDAAAALAAVYEPDILISPSDRGSPVRRGGAQVRDLHPDLALLLSTSGSTGSPKLVRLSAANVQANAEAIAEYLANHPKVDKVYWPGFPSHANHAIAAKQMRDFGGMMSFTMKGDDMADATRVLSSTKLFALAESLGGVESLLGHPASMTHASIPREERLKNGLADTLIRLSVGVEDVDDLIADLEQALG